MKIEDFKLSCELPGHKLDVRAVAEGDDFIVSGSRDKTAKIWTVSGNSYTDTETLKNHSNYVAAVLVIEEYSWICTASNDSTICIYRFPDTIPFATLKGHTSTVCCLVQGNAPNILISGSWDKTARIWTNIESSQSSVKIEGHDAAVWAVARLASGKYATGSADKNICIWNERGDKLVVLKGHKDCVRGLLSLPDGSLLSCSNDATIRHWNSAYECVKEFHGHSNYIYSIARSPFWGEDVFVTCSEDSTMRMWSVKDGALGTSIAFPAQSIWCIAGLKNGDIVTGSSDSMVRVFTMNPERCAHPDIQAGFNMAVEVRVKESSKELGGMNVNELPGPESLLSDGKDGQTRIVRHPDGKIMCYQWTNNKWDCVGDVMGASSGSKGKELYEGREYDYVFNVNLTDDAPCIKLPYTRGEDPWLAAQKFIHKHNLPQIYLDQVANFIVKNSDTAPVASASANSYYDPFTGGSRYVPGSAAARNQGGGNTDPFTGDSSYTTETPNVAVNFRERSNAAGNADPFTGGSSYSTGQVGGGKKDNKHFPFRHFMTLEKCDFEKVLIKLKDLNSKIEDTNLQMSNETLEDIVRYTSDVTSMSETNQVCINALKYLYTWPTEILFPVIDITRLVVKQPKSCQELMSDNFIDTLIGNINHVPANQLMVIRCLANMMTHELGRSVVIGNLKQALDKLGAIKSGSANLQIAIGTFFLNISMTQFDNPSPDVSKQLSESMTLFLSWAMDNEAVYRSYQALGNLMSTKLSSGLIPLIKTNEGLIEKILLNVSLEIPGFAKLNECANYLYELLA